METIIHEFLEKNILNSFENLHLICLPQLRKKALDFTILPMDSDTLNLRYFLILEIAIQYIKKYNFLNVQGVVDFNQKGHGMLRWSILNFLPNPTDMRIPFSMIQMYQLKKGHLVKGILALNKYHKIELKEILEIEGIPVAEWKTPTAFENFTPLFPNHRIYLDKSQKENITARAIDLIAPLGMGQRGIIVAPPRIGKTILLKNLAQAILTNHPEIHLILLLIDERPEEVTDFKKILSCDIFSSTFDESVHRHIHIANMVLERAKRVVEIGKNVVIMMDSITRLSRGYNNINLSGNTLSGGMGSMAMVEPKKFFGSARNTEEGGSLTILATALTETNSRIDDLIFEEYKGTGNMEIYLDRLIAEQRVFPSINIKRSGTRKEELLYHPIEYQQVIKLRQHFMELPPAEAMELLILNLKNTSSNVELLLGGLKQILK